MPETPKTNDWIREPLLEVLVFALLALGIYGHCQRVEPGWDSPGRVVANNWSATQPQALEREPIRNPVDSSGFQKPGSSI